MSSTREARPEARPVKDTWVRIEDMAEEDRRELQFPSALQAEMDRWIAADKHIQKLCLYLGVEYRRLEDGLAGLTPAEEMPEPDHITEGGDVGFTNA